MAASTGATATTASRDGAKIIPTGKRGIGIGLQRGRAARGRQGYVINPQHPIQFTPQVGGALGRLTGIGHCPLELLVVGRGWTRSNAEAGLVDGAWTAAEDDEVGGFRLNSTR